MKIVEIFKTNVQNNKDANNIIVSFLNEYPCYKTNFDLEDEDKIFRVEATQKDIEIAGIIKSIQNLGYSCERIE
ncbi:methyltransferase type 11 [Flavobacterium sp. NST-5]|uniref:Methyltransferase type 11 n=1 Tax=Flavobacterium ichthyis TaxID=2698827 RepID=A0ABW9Z9L7_9FLAO|nr:methyltransferase type 11 [Flavobacterium ichthyis]NBL65586.1 methyltransferase type 11 [Flavobacterium ichthyis]